MVLIVLKILGLLSLIHLHYLEFQRQGFYVKFYFLRFPLGEEVHVFDTNFVGFVTRVFLQGSARQLFQRLQGPMEEDTLKSHFENIIKIGQKQYYRRNQVWIYRYCKKSHVAMTLGLPYECYTFQSSSYFSLLFSNKV